MDKNQVLSYISDLEQKYNIPTGAFKQIVQQESQFKPGLTSKAGAYGYSQLMPGTAKDMGVDRYDPMQNLEGGAKYFSSIIHNQAKGDLPVAAAMYNSGPNAKFYKTNDVRMMPSETRNYMAAFKRDYQPNQKMTVDDLLAQGFTEEATTQPTGQSNTVKPMTVDDLLSQGFTEEKPVEQPQVKPTERTLTGALSEAVPNIPKSGWNLMKGTYEAIRHPVETAKGLDKLIMGEFYKAVPSAAKEASISSPEAVKQSTEAATAFNQVMTDRYGSTQGFYNALATDPVGVLSDISLPIKGGGLLAKAGAEKLASSARASRSAAQVLQPQVSTSPTTGPARIMSQLPENMRAEAARAELGSNLLGKVQTGLDVLANPVESLVSKTAPAITAPLSLFSGINPQTYAEAFKAGKSSNLFGTDLSKPFTESMRGNVPTENVVDMARGALNNMRAAKNEQYSNQLAAIPNINQPMRGNPLGDVRTRFNELNQQHTFRGTTVNPSVNNVRSQIDNALTEWETNNVVDSAYSSIAGVDALKRRVADIVDTTEPHTPENRFATQVYNEIKGLLNNTSPEYRTMTSDYAKHIGQIKDIERELSLKEGSNPGTALRKLQSLMRNNANTSWDYRNQLSQQLIDAGAKDLIPSLAGQNVSTWAPRGLAAQLTSGLGAIAGGATMHPGLLALPLASPRVGGELSYLLGKFGYQPLEKYMKGAKATPLRGSLLDYQEQKRKEKQ